MGRPTYCATCRADLVSPLVQDAALRCGELSGGGTTFVSCAVKSPPSVAPRAERRRAYRSGDGATCLWQFLARREDECELRRRARRQLGGTPAPRCRDCGTGARAAGTPVEACAPALANSASLP